MLDNILDIVKNIAGDAISGSADIPSDKKDLATKVTTNAIGDGLKSNISGLTDIFSGGGGSVIDSIKDNVVKALSDKIGINPETANNLASSIIPNVISALSGKINDPNASGFSLDSILGALSGGGSSSKGGILGALGKLFGK